MAIDAASANALIQSARDLCEDTLPVGSDLDTPADDADVPALIQPQAGRSTRASWMLIVAMVAVMTTLVGWLGVRQYHCRQIQAQQNQFLQAAKQGVVNLTTIDWHHADADIQRILDTATGQFYEDFAERSKPFLEVVKQVQATTTGTITAVGMESHTHDTAQVLVAASVRTSDINASEQPLRAWRMRVSVHRVDGRIKVSNVEFVA